MATKFSTGLRNYVLVTGSLKGALDGGKIIIYSGAEPATADAALGSATPLVTITDNGGAGGLTIATTASAGVVSKDATQVWRGTVGTSNTATFFRYVKTGDSGASSTTDIRIQGTVALAGADLNLSSVDLVATAIQSIDYFAIALPTL